ncbi:Peroxisome assembly protein 12 [Apiospora phragmitis]|uniref:Peroxisome assembly protein 12 n=1 Tax=Apiospora phragmitis TaxID=2905665 RepID=A0ABR1X6B9_9PEZI
MEFVTALRGTFDDQKPSLFELLSEQQLNALLPPTLRYLLTVATQRYPRYLLRALNSFDELYALLMLCVERHYLRTRGGGFTEHFYGLKREAAVGSGGELPRASHGAAALVRETLKLGRADVWRNLLVSVGAPYLKRRLDEAHEIEAPRALLGANYTRLPRNPTPAQRLVWCYRWFLRRVYPSVHAACGFAVLAFNLAYLFDGSKYHHPLLWLIGTRVRRMNMADYKALEELENQPTLGGGGRLGQNSNSAAVAAAGTSSSFLSPRTLGPKILGRLSVLLPTSIFALKFLEWWYASDFAKQLSRKAAENLELPPPVATGLLNNNNDKNKQHNHNNNNNNKGINNKNKQGGAQQTGDGDEKQQQKPKTPQEEDVERAANAPIATPSMLPIHVVPAPADSQDCPICEGEIVTPTACQTGVVYCYTCIHRWVEGTHPRQEDFMSGAAGGAGGVDRCGRWESGEGRCAVTGRRILGGTEGLRRIMV